jgi:hypothetical protein
MNKIKPTRNKDTLSPIIEKVISQLQEQRFSLKHTGISARMAHYYSEMHLLLNEEPVEGKRRFSAVELVWISILRDLFDTGMDKDAIRTIKWSCDTKYGLEITKDYKKLEVITAWIIAYQSDVKLLTTLEGYCTFMDYTAAYNYTVASIFSSHTHIVIPLFEKVAAVWKNLSNEEIFKRKIGFEVLNSNEAFVLKGLRSARGAVEDVNVHFTHERTLRSMAFTERINPKNIESVCKFLREAKHCSITITYAEIQGEAKAIIKKNNLKP